MNKEVEEAKEYFKELIKGYEQNLKEIENFDEYEEEEKFIKRRMFKLKVILTHIKALEEDNNWYNEETIALNNRIMDLEEKIKRYDNELDLDYVDKNYIPKQKVIDKIESIKELMLKNILIQKNEIYFQGGLDVLQNLLKEE